MTETVDILIAGGGPVGAALALALEGSGHSVVLAEARSADSGGARSADSGDARPIALSYASRLILERLNAWPGLAVTPIETIHVSQQGGFGRTLIRAADCGLPALGYVASYNELQQSLLAAPCSARRLFGARLTAFDGTTAAVQTQDGELAFAPRGIRRRRTHRGRPRGAHLPQGLSPDRSRSLGEDRASPPRP